MDILLLTGLFFCAATLYSSVGHAGASGYLAAMALVGIAPATMKPTALLLNIVVASVATLKFYRAGHFSWNVFFPLVMASVPLAFVGSSIHLSGTIYKALVGIILLWAAYRLWLVKSTDEDETVQPAVYLVIIAGLAIGFLSGLTGTGGGIFLTPLLLFMKWSDTKEASGISAAFILANSIAGLLGDWSSLDRVSEAIPIWIVAVLVGGWLGASYGSQQADKTRLQRLLAMVLVIAGLKLIAS